MQFIFNYLLSLQLDRRTSATRYFICLGLFLIVGLASNTVSGQRLRRARPDNVVNERIPTHFGDTPSPTEMMARLKYHKQQETPLFDLLREAGVDIFSKLSDDEKKLAGKFVEDMILKEGLDSERVSSLMDKMKIGSEAKQALQEGIDRAGGGESAVSPEQRKELANNIRKNFLQRSESQLNDLKLPTNQNQQPPELPAELPAELVAEREALNKRLEELGIESNHPGRSAPNNREGDLARQQDRDRQANQAENQAENQNNRLPPPREPSRPSRQLAGPEAGSAPDFRQREPNRPGPANGFPNDDTANNSVPPASPAQSEPSSRALDRLESKLSEAHRKIAAEFTNRIQRGDISPQEIGELLEDLNKLQSADDIAGQLDEVGEKFGLPAEDRQEFQDAFNELSPAERGSLKQKFDGIDKALLDQLANSTRERVNRGLDSGELGSGELGSREPGSDLSELIASSVESIRNEQLGKEFLKDALETYNDAESGYELSPAFKQLKDRAEGIRSDREMANFGNLSKKLFDESAKLFDPKSASESRSPNGVKPGQRLDQLLAAAADKALAGDASDGEGKSLFSDALNNALGVALEQAVDIADKDAENRNREAQEGWFPEDDFDPQNQFESFENYDATQFTTPPESPANNSPTSTSSDNESSMNQTAAAIADSISEFEFNGWTLLYAVALIGLLAGIAFLIFRMLPSGDKSVQQQRELERMLQNKLAKPKDVVEAVDLFLISRFGTASSWWNAKHAADQISTSQPDWRDKVASLFQVYRWSRYQADGNASVTSEQNELVNSTLQELNQAPEDAFAATKTDAAQSSTADDEATS